MLVKELIEKLQELPEELKDAPVLCTTEIGLMDIDIDIKRLISRGIHYKLADVLYKNESQDDIFYACIIDW